MTKSLSHNNGSLSYSVYGKGKAVMLVHGFGEDSRIWNNQVSRFKADFQLIVPDLPGSGKSDFAPEIFSMDDHADLLLQLLDAEKLEVADIVGHSMGGYIALAFAEKHHERMTGLCLFHSTAYADNQEKIESRRKSIEFIREHGSFKFLQQATPNLFSDKTKTENSALVEEIIARYSNFNPESLVHYYEAMIQRPDRSEVLRKLSKPVLFIAGEQDTAIPLKHMLEQSYLPELSYFHSLKNSGHMGMLEEPDLSNHYLETLLNNS